MLQEEQGASAIRSIDLSMFVQQRAGPQAHRRHLQAPTTQGRQTTSSPGPARPSWRWTSSTTQMLVHMRHGEIISSEERRRAVLRRERIWRSSCRRPDPRNNRPRPRDMTWRTARTKTARGCTRPESGNADPRLSRPGTTQRRRNLPQAPREPEAIRQKARVSVMQQIDIEMQMRPALASAACASC